MCTPNNTNHSDSHAHKEPETGKPTKIIFISDSLADPRMSKRIEDFANHGYDTEVYGFDRGIPYTTTTHYRPHIVGDITGCTSYAKRLPVIRCGIKKILATKDAQAIYYIFGLQIAMVFRTLCRHRYIYEEADLVHTYVSNPIKSILERIDKHIIRKSMLTVLTSEGFARYHFGPKTPSNIYLIPNKLQHGILGLPDMAKTRPENGHLRIGFLGGVRYRSIISFAKYALKNHPHVELHFHGRVAAGMQDDFDLLRKSPNCHVHGPFKNPDDLPRIYSGIDLVLSTYDICYENVRFAEPNKLYESIFFRTPIIVSSGTFLADKVHDLGIGYDVNALDESSVDRLLSAITEEELSIKRKAAGQIEKEYATDNNEDFFLRLESL